MAKRKFVLLRLEGCPYCERVEKELEKRGIEYKKITIESSDRSLVEMLSGQPSVPVLLEVIGCENQDDDIIEYLDEKNKK